MPGVLPSEDPWVGQQIVMSDLSEIEGCSIAVDATYFIQMMLDAGPAREPLMAALGGITGFQKNLGLELDQWAANNVIPFFVFDGQPVVGQEDVAIEEGLRDIAKTDIAWELYFGSRASEAVIAFGEGSTFRIQTLYPVLQRTLKARNLHFITPPYSAAAQLAYFDMVDSEQCAGIMGQQELLLYPIHDCIIRAIDWETNKVTYISKKQILRNLNVSEPMFIDAFLMTGSSFLPSFPPLRDGTTYPRQPSVMDALNMLRTADKNIANLCASFHDVLQAQDPNWLDKFRKARMVVDHFIYVAESGEIQVYDFEKLTKDNHLYLGLQLPSELFHYLNTGLVGPEVLSWISHGQITILPTLEGYASPEYRELVSKQLVPYYETALGLVIPRLNRGLQFRDIVLKVWYDKGFSLSINHRNEGNSPASRVEKWNVTGESLSTHFPKAQSGTIAFELSAFANKDFIASTLNARKAKGLESEDAIVSLSIWKLLTLNGYIKEKTLELTAWGTALAKTLSALEPLAAKAPDPLALFHAALLSYELIRLGLLTTGHRQAELQGWPVNGSEEDKSCVVLISRVATLLQLRQDVSGYTGPLSKNLLAFHSMTVAVGSANRNVIEALLANTFMSGQAKRSKLDNWKISHRLPFYEFPDAALSIAVKTFLDESTFDTTPEQRQQRQKEFPENFIPRALKPFEDFDMVFGLVDALHAGVGTLGDSEMKADVKADWDKAKKYLDRRR
ncbi:xpg i-region protein [Grosmannia clavigera kw1407]|uniref:Xpg i-region protein n=1 Tax=Grosmannia clavigera (strain kw1407 / UAMH 11150) TaxID=655863 RepID=F0XG55_GROCL|nr:xpg i-region protein [Grosmannia clavigera kw1407]EFX03005.1 xpg i-region protein [Grosmannia clavigera kw1407]